MRIAIVTGPQPTQHGQERWTEDDSGLVSGLVISTATLASGAEATLLTLYHEAAHVLAWRRGLEDTSRRATYHNRTYLALAQEIGLDQPAGTSASRVRGFEPALTTDVQRLTADALESLQHTIDVELPAISPPASATKSSPDRQMLECACETPRKIRVSPRVAAKGPIICGVCGEHFTAP
ncbi:hypothetical protein [Streptomyces sp. NPDC056061]|uniref:hypothetical protein n=1 Tax=Streptomyces sp. NPDC056061 TaxID=3345700 RepID=UPI0035D9B66C